MRMRWTLNPKRQMSPDNVFFFNYVCENNEQDMVLVLSEAYFDLSFLFGVIIRSLQVDSLIKSFYWWNEPFQPYQGLSFIVVFRPKGLRGTCKKRRLESIYSCEKQFNSLTQIGAYITI